MNLSKEHILSLKISVLLLIFALFISYLIGYFNHLESGIINSYGKGKGGIGYNMGLGGNNKYIVFVILSVIIYFVSYFLAKFTIKPIEEHNKKLKEYNHNLAHELKTPVSVIKSNLELLELSYDKNLVKSSFDELSLMNKVIDSLLFLSEKNELSSSENIDLVSILKDNIDKIDKNILFNNSVKVANIKGNLGLINSLIRNLLENALKYRKKKTQVEVNINNKSFEVKNYLNKSIDKESLNKLFDTFYQLDCSRHSSGYGLGLSIVKKICDIHKFKIKLMAEKDFFIVKIDYK